MSAPRAGLALLALGLAATAATAGTVRKIRDRGPDANRVVIAIVGDGYLASQETRFEADAARALDGFLADSPHANYAGWVNAYTDFVPSAEEGADKPAACYGTEVLRDTAFDATYCTEDIQRLVTVDDASVFTLLNADVPTWDLAAVIVNDSEYGGSGGALLTFSTHSGALEELFLHEAGHTLALLADTYGGEPDPYMGPEPVEPNATLETDRLAIKWEVWIDPATPVPTPPTFPGDVGLFEGGLYHDLGVHRPRYSCKMRNLGQPWCEVCREAHVQRLHERVSLIDDLSPPEGPVVLPPCGPTEFRLELVEVVPSTLEVEWLLDGLVLPGETEPVLSLEPASIPPGGAPLEARVFDATDFVRRAFVTPMTDSASWELGVADPADLDGDGLDDGCDPDIDGDLVPNEEDCAPRDPALSAPAPEVTGLLVGTAGGGLATLEWDDVLAAQPRPAGRYALAAGGLAELRSDGGFDRACRVDLGAAPSHEDARGLPPTDPAGRWYVVGIVDACGSGALGAERAGLDLLALGPCP